MYFVYFVRVLDVGLKCVFLLFQIIHEFEYVHFIDVAEALLDEHDVEVVVDCFLEGFVRLLDGLHGDDVILVVFVVVDFGIYLPHEFGQLRTPVPCVEVVTGASGGGSIRFLLGKSMFFTFDLII